MQLHHWVTRLVGAPLVAALLSIIVPQAADAKTPGNTYCFLGTCHRVLTLGETAARVGRTTTLQTSFYDSCTADRFNPCGLTSSGEAFNASRPDNAASPILPNGTVILVRNPGNGRTAILRINNAGPYWGKRTLDVSRGAADALGFRKRGVAKLEVQVISAPTKAEAAYRRNRSYAKVAGPIGSFASVSAAGAHYAALTAPAAPKTTTALASLYPQQKADNVGTGPDVTGNGIERTWLRTAMTFKPSTEEAKRAKRTFAKLGQSAQASARQR
ncbi:MAG: hypothetical protein K2Y05_06800 [Hyphomicrobiaceae bacterium]|nr:hypothetical protein [Hyphomicrobiaceae bacterium]